MLSSKSFVLFFLLGERMGGGLSNFCLCGKKQTIAEWCEEKSRLVSGIILAGGEKSLATSENRNKDREIMKEIHLSPNSTRTWGYPWGKAGSSWIPLASTQVVKRPVLLLTAGVAHRSVLYDYSGTLMQKPQNTVCRGPVSVTWLALRSQESLHTCYHWIAKGVLRNPPQQALKLMPLNIEMAA